MTTTAFEDANIQNLLETIAKDEGFKQPSYSISAGSNAGDNYCCRIYRAVITEVGGSKTLSLIFKVSIPRKSSRKNAVYEMANKKEQNAYEKVLPALNNILKKYGLSECDHFPRTAKYFASYQDDSSQVLVLEDKCADGFRTLGEVKFLDIDHCRQILRSIALIHAASIALRKHDPKTFEITKSYLSPKDANAKNDTIFEEMQESAAAGLKLLPESFKKKSSFIKMEKAVENFSTLVAKANKVPPDFSCIIQGDCWYNNALYKYSQENVLEEICLIDFQAIRLTSPATELSYMFFLCTQKELRDESYDDLIRFYHSELSALLKTMDCDEADIIPLQVLEEHMKKYGQMGPLIASAGLSIHLIDCVEEPVHLKFAEDEDSLYFRRVKLPPNKERKEILENILMNVVEDADARGLI